MNFNQGVGRAFDRPLMSQSPHQTPDQGGLAGAQIAVEPDPQTRRHRRRQGGAQGQGSRLVGQIEAQGMIAGMHDWMRLAQKIKVWGRELGFDAVGIAGADLAGAGENLAAWLAAGYHGEMDYMAAHGDKRSRPAGLVPGTRAVVVVRLNYLPEAATGTPVARYALGRDYHRLLRQRLQKLADRITAEVGPFGHRACVDSAPVMETELATRAGLGWRGKHTLLLTREAGSWFFLGELFVDLPLPADAPAAGHCGRCRRCLDACPTGALVAPGQLDARRCISYLTIELKGSIPPELRPLLGAHIYGCDDCQLCCPWNRFAPPTAEADFAVRNEIDRTDLTELFAWEEAEFAGRLAGSAIRRLGHERWLRNIAVALGNGPASPKVIAALKSRRDHPSALVREHTAWALSRQGR